MKIHQFCKLIDSKVAFTTPDGNFEGILKFFVIPAERVTFEHVFLIPSREYMGTMHVLFSDINSYTLLEPADQIIDDSKFDSSKELLIGGFEKRTKIDEMIIELSPGKHFFESLPSNVRDKCANDFCVIDSVSPTFQRAINHLLQLNTIGVSFQGPKLSRCGNISWICISSSMCVFMFDIEQLGMVAFMEGLKDIFEDEEIEKVIHDCREAADCLLHKFETNLKNVFDTQVADFLINMQMYTGQEIFKYVSSLDSCLVKYLKVPPQFLYNRNKCIAFDDEVSFFKERPISEEYTNVLMKTSMYLLLLKEMQENLLLYPFEQAVELYLNGLRTATDSEVYREPTQFTQIAPAYLLESIKSVRFHYLPQPPDDFVDKFKETLHGQKVWQQKMLMKNSKISNDLDKDKT